MRNELLLQKYDNEKPYAWHAYHAAFCGGCCMIAVIATEMTKEAVEEKVKQSEYKGLSVDYAQVTEAAYRKFKGGAKSHQCFQWKSQGNGIELGYLDPKM